MWRAKRSKAVETPQRRFHGRRATRWALLGVGYVAQLLEPLVPVDLPAQRHGHRIERFAGGLLSFGGFGDPGAPDREARQTWWLAAGAREWVRAADLQREHAFAGSVVVGGAIHAVGAGVERWDGERRQWVEVVPPGALPASHFAAAAVGGTLFVLGGYSPSPKCLLAIDLLSEDGGFVAEPAVRELPPPPGYAAGDHFHFLVTLAGELHVLGGLDGEAFEPKAEHWLLGKEGWIAQPPPPVALWAKFAVQAIDDDELLLFGDSGAWRFSAASRAWTKLASPPGILAMPQAVIVDGTLHVLGGMLVGSEDANVHWRYHLATDSWEAPSRAPPARDASPEEHERRTPRSAPERGPPRRQRPP